MVVCLFVGLLAGTFSWISFVIKKKKKLPSSIINTRIMVAMFVFAC